MTYRFDQKRLLNNISVLIQQRGYKVGELETSISVSQGYLSRLARGESSPSMEIIYKIAKLLDVNIERLIEGDFDRNATNLAYLQKFVHKIFSKTMDGGLEWKSVSIADINSSLMGESEFLPNVCTNESVDFSTAEMEFRRVGYDRGSMIGQSNRGLFSFTRPRSTVKASDSFFFTDFGPTKRLYVFKYAEVLYDKGIRASRPYEWYELVFRIGNEGESSYEPITNTLGKCSPLQEEVDALYEELKYHEDDLRINKTVRDVIDEFMNDLINQ